MSGQNTGDTGQSEPIQDNTVFPSPPLGSPRMIPRPRRLSPHRPPQEHNHMISATKLILTLFLRA